MKIQKTKIEDLYLIEPEPFEDLRGNFQRVFCQKELLEEGINFEIRQINQSLGKKKGTLRGFHFQEKPKSEDKIIQCIRGAVFDVALDLRKDSGTYGEWVVQELTEKNRKMFLIPKGFAHAFQTLVDNSEIQYFISDFYSPEQGRGIPWNDPDLGIPWPIKDPILSEKDKNWPSFKEYGK